MYINKTTVSADIEQMNRDLESILILRPWPEVVDVGNQIGLRHRLNAVDPWLDAHGSLYDSQQQKFVASETDFSKWNSATPAYTRSVVEDLAQKQGFTIGRVRYMRQPPKRGLSVHRDLETRYHFVLKTNPFAFFGFTQPGPVTAQCYHIPSDGYFYHADTTQEHFVYNGGWEERIHLVICAV
jgi:hypothetical protein